MKVQLPSKKVLVTIIISIILGLSVPITILVIRNPQSNQSKASAATTLSFEPASITALQNNQFAVDLYLDPGSNIPSIVDAHILFDPQKVEFVRVDTIGEFGGSLRQPIISSNVLNINITLPTGELNSISSKTKIRTIIFKALTPGEVTLSFDNVKTRVFSLNAQDEAGENVLSNSIPTTVTIQESSVILPTLTPPPNPNNKARIEVQLDLPGVSSQSAVLRTKRSGTLFIIDRENKKAVELPIELNYEGGLYKGTALWQGIPNDTDVYTMKIKVDNSLVKLIPGIYNLKTQNQLTQVTKVSLITGDLDNNNQLDSKDYQSLIDCIGQAAGCVDDKKIFADLDDNGKVDEFDLNIFQRGFSAKVGD